MQRLEIEYIHLDEIIRHPRNAKRHDRDGIASSIERFSFADPVLLNSHPDTDFMLAGHGRCEALLALRDEGKPRPEHIDADADGRWLVPSVRISLPPGQAEAFMLAHNQLTINGGWDEEALATAIKELGTMEVDLGGLGWEPEEIAFLLKPPDEPPPEPPPPEPPVDPAEVLQKKWQTAAGQIWKCGDHYLVCCDGADESLWGCMPEPIQLALTFTSPPYEKQRNYRLEEPFDWGKVVPAVMTNCALHGPKDQQILVSLGLVHQERRVIVYWQPLLDAMEERGAPLFGWYVWDQGCGLAGDWNGRLSPSHEFVFHFCAKPRQANKIIECKCAGEYHHPGDQDNTGLRSPDGTNRKWTGADQPVQSHKIPDSVIREPRQYGGVPGHPAPFSIPFASLVIEAYSNVGEWVCDPFAGSGTTLLAAEQTQRRCIAIDLEPSYIAIALERWSNLTGLQPRLIDKESK